MLELAAKPMTVAAFLAWNDSTDPRHELVVGSKRRAMTVRRCQREVRTQRMRDGDTRLTDAALDAEVALADLRRATVP